jgi:hypothetical protein
MTPNTLLRNHLFTAAPLLVTKAADVVNLAGVTKLSVNWKHLTMRMLLVQSIALTPRILLYRMAINIALLLIAAWVFWRLAHTEGKWLRYVAGAMFLFALWEAHPLAIAVLVPYCDLPTWIWLFSGCWAF